MTILFWFLLIFLSRVFRWCSCLSASLQVFAITYSTLVLMLPLSFFCELHHTFLLLSHTLHDILRQVPSFLFPLSPPLACLVLFASWFHHSLLSVAPGHFFSQDLSACWVFTFFCSRTLDPPDPAFKHLSLKGIHCLVSRVPLDMNGGCLSLHKQYWSGSIRPFYAHTMSVSSMLKQPWTQLSWVWSLLDPQMGLSSSISHYNCDCYCMDCVVF